MDGERKGLEGIRIPLEKPLTRIVRRQVNPIPIRLTIQPRFSVPPPLRHASLLADSTGGTNVFNQILDRHPSLPVHPQAQVWFCPGCSCSDWRVVVAPALIRVRSIPSRVKCYSLMASL